MHALLVVAYALTLTQGADSRPVIEKGREAEILALFADCGTGATAGWRLESVRVPYDSIRATFRHSDGARVRIELLYKPPSRRGHGPSRSFAYRLLEHRGIDRQKARAFVLAVMQGVDRRDQGRFWKDAKTGTIPTVNVSPHAFWRWELGRQVAWAWLLALAVLVILVGLGWAKRKPWRSAEGRSALLEVALLFGLALYVRWWIVQAGPGNLYSRVKLPSSVMTPYPLYGPGLDGWLLAWFRLLGVHESTVYFAGAFAGSLTVVAVYVIGRAATGRRLAGVLGAMVLALWPMHALHSTTSEPFSLVALLMAASVALVLAAERAASPLLLVAAWLALALAATVRPEPMLAMPLLALLVALGPTTRRLQRQPAPLVATALVLGVAVAAVWLPATAALSLFRRDNRLVLQDLWHLVGGNGGSMLGPPRTSLVLTVLVLVGIAYTWRRLRWRSLLLLGIPLAPAVPTSVFAGPDFVSARYQLPLMALAAAVAGIGLAGAADGLAPRLGRYARWGLPAAGLVLFAWVARGVVWPPPEPTFRLEHRFFRKHLPRVPGHCWLVRVRWNRDLGLGIPSELTDLYGAGHRWISAGEKLMVEDSCLVYWRPSSCRAVGPGERRSPDWQLPDCAMIESRYRLEPIAQTRLPARTGLFERYLDDPVRVGFYRLRRRGP